MTTTRLTRAATTLLIGFALGASACADLTEPNARANNEPPAFTEPPDQRVPLGGTDDGTTEIDEHNN